MKQYELVTNVDAGVNVTSVRLDLGDLKDYSIHVNFTGATLSGNLTLEASNDVDEATADWVLVTGSTQAIATAASHMWNISVANYRFVRVQWSYSAGAGNITVKAILKQMPVVEG